MEFDKSKVYTVVNADELKIGSKVIVADSLGELKNLVEIGDTRNIHTVIKIYDCYEQNRFAVGNNYCKYALAYLVSEPREKRLAWTDLKIGDIIRQKGGTISRMVTAIDYEKEGHIYAVRWLSNDDLLDFLKVEDNND